MDLYWPAVSAMAGSAVGVIAPIYAAVAAWEAGRLKRGGVEGWTSARPWYAVVLDATALPLLCSACALLAALSSLLPEVGSVPGTLDWRFIGVAVLVCIGFTFVGFGAGRLLKPVYAVPLCLVGTYLWLVYPISMEPLWLRHLTGNYDMACCRFHEIPDIRALAAGALVGGAITVTGFGISMIRRNAAAEHSALGLVSLSLVVYAGVLVHDTGWAAAVSRPNKELVCGSSAGSNRLTVCMWPEHARDTKQVAVVASGVIDRLVAAGLKRPKRLTEGLPAEKEWKFSYSRDLANTSWGVAFGLVPQGAPKCQDKGRQWIMGDMVLPLVSWLAYKAGASIDSVERRIGKGGAAMVREVIRSPATSQIKWFHENMRLLKMCDVKPAKVS